MTQESGQLPALCGHAYCDDCRSNCVSDASNRRSGVPYAILKTVRLRSSGCSPHRSETFFAPLSVETLGLMCLLAEALTPLVPDVGVPLAERVQGFTNGIVAGQFGPRWYYASSYQRLRVVKSRPWFTGVTDGAGNVFVDGLDVPIPWLSCASFRWEALCAAATPFT